MQSVDPEFEEFGVSKAVGMALQNSDFGVGSFQRSGRNAVVIVVEDAVAMGREGVGEANQQASTGTLGTTNPIVEKAQADRIGVLYDVQGTNRESHN